MDVFCHANYELKLKLDGQHKKVNNIVGFQRSQ